MNIFEFVKKALSEDNGNPSSMRLMSFTGFIQWAAVISFGFIWVLIYYPAFILGYLATLATLIFGILGLKAYQKKQEGGSPDEPK